MPAADINWVSLIRRFIATERYQFLQNAVEACPDRDVRTFLDCAAGELRHTRWLSEELFSKAVEIREALSQQQGRDEEAAVVMLFRLRDVVRQLQYPQNSNDRAGAMRECNLCLLVCTQYGFIECLAWFFQTH